ncbi:hypothetical protein Tco_0675761 [Tanacetum coccineum]
MNVQSSSNQIELHFPNPEKSLQFRQEEKSEFDNLFHDHIQGEDKNAEDIQMADHLRLMEELIRIPILGIEDAIIAPAVLADQFELKPELLDFINSSSGGISTQIDAITALTKQVKALEYHFASMRETYDQNQEAAVELMQNQMGKMADFQERPLGELSSNTRTNPLAKLKVITSTNGLTLDGSFLPHSNFLVYQEKEQEPETIMEVLEIANSKSTPLVPPPETLPTKTLGKHRA